MTTEDKSAEGEKIIDAKEIDANAKYLSEATEALVSRTERSAECEKIYSTVMQS